MIVRMTHWMLWVVTGLIYVVVSINGFVSDEVIRLLSPDDRATLVATTVMVLIQLPVRDHQLIDKNWVLCIRANMSGEQESSCIDDYSATGFDSTNNTILLFKPAVHDGTFFLEATLQPPEHRISRNTLIYSVISHFNVILPLSDSAKQLENAPTKSNSIADFTYLQDNSFDMIRMRMREHEPDALLLVDTNESHSGFLEKKYVVPEGTGSPLSTNMEQHEGTTMAISPEEFSDIINIEPRYFASSFAAAAMRILVNHPPSRPDAKLREMLHRDSVGALCRQLESSNTLDTSPHPDMYIVSDTDEIIHRKAIRALKVSKALQRSVQNSRDTIIFMLLDFHLYNFNWKFPNQQWGLFAQEGAFVAPASLVRRFTSSAAAVNGSEEGSAAAITASGVRRLLRPANRQLLLQLASEYNIVYWDHAGWHLSQFYSPAEMARAKKMALSDQEEAFMNKMWTEENCAIMQDYGVPHYMLEGRKQGINYMLEGKNPLVFHPVHSANAALADISSTTEGTKEGQQSTADQQHLNASAEYSIAAIDAFELEHDMTLPLAVYEDQALLRRHVHRTHDTQGPDLPSRRSAAEYLVEQYIAALPPSQSGGQVIYSAPADAGTYVQFTCYTPRTANVRLDGSADQGRRILMEQAYEEEEDALKQVFYRAEVMDKLFCSDKARCPYSESEEAIAFAVQWVSSQCKSASAGTVSIQVLSA